ncbi:MAG: hypothetical protein BMS9Abin18_0678 [Zetaproteobacteria bacterium]|nr:MAG: hypothetical protein BMS9Abin18_0678 [Zetaproteobacteria bacterium]
MQGQSLFDITAETHHIELFLGEYDCDVPFGGGEMERVGVSLTTDSPRSRHGIPVLRLQGGHQMDFTAHEQTPAGHAAKLVADWLEHNNPVSTVRHVAELFLWQWPGIQQTEDGHWQLTSHDERSASFSGVMVDWEGTVVAADAADADMPKEEIIQSVNVQVLPYGFCRKKGPCYLLDACLLCPFFMTNAHFLPTLIARTPELQGKLKDALSTNNHRLTESCREALQAIEAINKALQNQSLESEV